MRISNYKLFIVSLFCISFYFSCTKKQYSSKKSETTLKQDSIAIVQQEILKDTGDLYLLRSEDVLHFEIMKDYYIAAYEELHRMLSGEQELSFKRAVFVVENAWKDETINYEVYNKYLTQLSSLCKIWYLTNKGRYNYEDSVQMGFSNSIYKIMTDTIRSADGKIISYPYQYDFEDNFAQKNWENMFLTKLMSTHKGNCHSLPFLYKILAEELDVKAYLSFVPNHIYIKQKSKEFGWYNTELTNNMFPSDAWVMTSGYVSREAIVSGIYMDTIGSKQNISICLNDLAKGYLRKRGNEANLNFVLKCCNLGLMYFPNYAELLLLKAETLKKKYLVEKSTELYNEMEETYSTLAKLHYREISEQMYNEWMASMQRNKNVYNRNELSNSINPKTK